jgi:hypothetical protein
MFAIQQILADVDLMKITQMDTVNTSVYNFHRMWIFVSAAVGPE